MRESCVCLGWLLEVVILLTIAAASATPLPRESDHPSQDYLDLQSAPDLATNATVNAMVIQSDGKIVIGGDFASVEGTPRNQLARLNADGKVDPDFDPPIAYPGFKAHAVGALVVQPDGKLVVAGTRIFTKPTGYLRTGEGHYVARLTPAGELDPTFTVLTYTNRMLEYTRIDALAQQFDGKILLSTTQRDSLPQSRGSKTVRLNVDGSVDSEFQALNIQVYCLLPQADGRILVGTDSGVVRVNPDGSLDENFHREPDLGRVLALAAKDKFLLTTGTRTARIQIADGMLDATFASAIAGSKIIVTSDGRFLVAEHMADLTTRLNLLNSEGVPDLSYIPVTFAQAQPLYGVYPIQALWDMQMQPNGQVLAAGSFMLVNDVPLSKIARIRLPSPAIAVPPTIVLQPTNQVVFVGQEASLAVQVSGTPIPAVQWLFDGIRIQGATNLVISIPHVALNDAGFYQVVASNSVGIARSDTASLSVKEAESSQLRIVNPRRIGSQFAVTIPIMEPDKAFFLEFRRSLRESAWQTADQLKGTGTVGTLSDSTALDGERFYRIHAD